VTAHPTSAWVAQQVREAFPFEQAPRYLIRDRDSSYGDSFRRCLNNLGTEEVLIAPQSPPQNPFVERLIGTIRRDCLDHVIVLNAAHLRHIITRYLDYYHLARCHRSLDGNSASWPFPTLAACTIATPAPPSGGKACPCRVGAG
jgi:putative transposase